MKTDLQLSHYQEINVLFNNLKEATEEMEREIDEYCNEYVKSQEDLQMISLFNSMLDEMYQDLERLEEIKAALYN
jgi:predicted nuclease with TOPRIM domain